MKKLISAGVISLALLTGSAFAFDDHDHDRDDHHRRHARIVRTYDGRVLVVRHRNNRHHRYYYDRQHRMYDRDRDHDHDGR